LEESCELFLTLRLSCFLRKWPLRCFTTARRSVQASNELTMNRTGAAVGQARHGLGAAGKRTGQRQAVLMPRQSGTAQSASTECLVGDPMHLMEESIDCFNIVSGERIFDDRPNLLKSFSWSHRRSRHQAASASGGTMEPARREVL
jgi:hypothetical protein